MKALFSPLIFSAALLSASAAEPAPAPAADIGNLRYADFVAAAGSYDEIIVWAGIPATADKAALEKEVAAKKAIRLHAAYFDAKPVLLKDSDRSALSDAVLKHKENFTRWMGVKTNAAFHADYAIEWRAKGVMIAQAFFSFASREAEFYTGGKMEKVDQSRAGEAIIRELLPTRP